MQDHAWQTPIVIPEETNHPTTMPQETDIPPCLPQETTPATFSGETTTKDIPVTCDESVRIITYQPRGHSMFG